MGLVRDFQCRSRSDGFRQLKGRFIHRVCNNTLLTTDVGLFEANSEVLVQLNGLVIARLSPDGIRLYSGGYKTSTTKHRLNRCLPTGWRLFQKKGEWYLFDGVTKETHDWFEGFFIPVLVDVMALPALVG